MTPKCLAVQLHDSHHSTRVPVSGCLAAMDLVEVNPLLAPVGANDTTVDMAVGLIASALGNRII